MRELTRKELLAGAAAAGVVAGCGSSAKKPPAYDPRDWASVKAQYGLSRDVRHFDAFVLSSHPRPVREAIERHRRGLDADAARYVRENEAELDGRVADAAAGYLGVSGGDLAFTDSTTMGLGLVYGGVEARNPVATEHDFYATHEALRQRYGRLRLIRLYDDPAQATVQGIVEAAKDGVYEDTGVLALTWVHSSTGVKLPLPEIAQALDGARRRGLLVVVDGVHGLGADDEPVRIESFDVLVAGCHKWLGGPRGTGLVWSMQGAGTGCGRRSRASRRCPTRPGSRVARRRATPRPAPPSRPAAITRSSTGGRWPRRSPSRLRSAARAWRSASARWRRGSSRGWPSSRACV